ncbi:MAG TPA: hypothetical protein PKA90_11050 [Ignavibacteria bacterium]|nr:hypothetical protein [Ignavibacteria bacterium]HMR40955.1 hypothetical protein [Ignavibacteria bacterium]
MSTLELINEIKKLPSKERLIVIEKIKESLFEKEVSQIERAAELFAEDYKTDNELIAFTSLDYEDFYETR